jgi:uncharacterized protein YcsI (UPF0317 family)
VTAAEVRREIREGRRRGPTAGAAPGYVQANLVALDAAYADAFEAFCRRNPQACPLLEVTAAGATGSALAPGADLRTDLPRYRVHRGAEVVGEPPEVRAHWGARTVAFLIGCSFTFEHALLEAGIPLRHVARGRNVAMYRTAIPCHTAGPFAGNLVVSMRPLPRGLVEEAIAICASLPDAHGAPVAVGDSEALGIADPGLPDFGEAEEVRAGEVAVYWACGVTAVEAARAAAVPGLITHAPGHMFLTDHRVGQRLADAPMVGLPT